MKRIRGYTILELLVVMAIMGLLGTVATGGYRAMVTAMEERGVRQNVNAFLVAAFQRAQIDQLPIVVYFWNEPLRRETEETYGQVVGRAVAVRPWGRISDAQGSKLIDEFSSLETLFPTNNLQVGGSASAGATRKLYALDDLSSKSRQYTYVDMAVTVYAGESSHFGADGILSWAHTKADGASTFNDWKPGTLFGLEFLNLELTDGYVFGGSKPSFTTVQDVDSFVIRPREALAHDIEVSVLRQNGTELQATSIGRSDKLDKDGNPQ